MAAVPSDDDTGRFQTRGCRRYRMGAERNGLCPHLEGAQVDSRALLLQFLHKVRPPRNVRRRTRSLIGCAVSVENRET